MKNNEMIFQKVSESFDVAFSYCEEECSGMDDGSSCENCVVWNTLEEINTKLRNL